MSLSVPKLLIGTHNQGKVRELGEMLSEIPIILAHIGEFPDVIEVEETGLTFAENARLKAVGYARQTGLVSLADDSGLAVAALGGRPGVLSARYGGEDTPFAEKIRLLLDEVATADAGRDACFVCAIAIASPEGDVLAETDGICSGHLADSPRGDGGFGYDPIFIPDGFDETFGELPSAKKAQLSHRGRAFAEIIPFLRHFFSIST